MKPLAYNHFGEIVCEDALGARGAGRSASRLDMEPEGPTSSRFLRCDINTAESFWLAAVAFCSQPTSRRIPINEFFKLCCRHLLPADRELALPIFVVEALHAFYRSRQPLFDHSNATALSFKILEQEFDDLGFTRALARLPALSSLAVPRAVLALRALSRRGSLPRLLPSTPYFDPFDLTDAACPRPSGGVIPWSLSEASRLTPLKPNGREESKSQSLSDLVIRFEGETVFIDRTGVPTLSLSLSSAITAIADSKATQIGTTGRHPYVPLTGSGAGESSLTTSLRLAHERLRQDLSEDLPEWDTYVSNLLDIPVQELAHRLSAEQIDACRLAARSFSARKAFILADETGLGKGRSLAALAKAFLRLGRKVVFMTEKKHLFSDFWRDLGKVYGEEEVPVPFLLHPKGRILTASGATVVKAPSLVKYKEQLATQQISEALLFTTYSQFNRDAKQSDKFQALLAHLDGALLILDESHNASGESQTRSNIFAFIDAADKCIFSSATYAKHEQAFELYASATPLTRNEMSLLLASFTGGDPLAASNSIAHGLVSVGSMVRREHMPEPDADSRLVAPDPGTQLLILERRHALHLALDSLFLLQERIDGAKQRMGEPPDASWMRLGGVLARVCKQFNLLSKIDLACDITETLLLQGKKPVLALESTFESFLKAQLDWLDKGGASFALFDGTDEQSETEESGSRTLPAKDLSFQALFRLVIESVAPHDLLIQLKDPTIGTAKISAMTAAENLPDWLASPLDLLRSRLGARGRKVGEISGRSSQLIELENGMIEVRGRAIDEREILVRQFNAGELDVLILTQAGASGISLHAAPEFADKRPRAFIELEICANPSQRMQFLGRVRRKGQVVSPEYLVVTSGSPYEHRLIERATGKQRMLSGLTSATQSLAAGSLSVANRLLSPQGDRIAEEWLKSHPEVARRLGIDIIYGSKPMNGDSLSERLLKRLPLLAAGIQDEIFAFINAALDIEQRISLAGLDGIAYLRDPLLIRSAPIWGPATAKEKSTRPQAFEAVVYLQEWVCIPPVGNIGSAYAAERIEAARINMRDGRVDNLHAATGRALKQSNLPVELRERLQTMRSAASHLAPGAKIRLTHPDTGRPLDGILVEIEPPANPKWELHPSQWGLSAIFPGQPFELRFSLASFFFDPCAYLEMTAAPPARVWDSFQERPYHFATFDGHCGYSRWFADQLGCRSVARFDDAQGTARELSISPPDATLERASRWKIPLIDPRLTLQLLQHDTQLALDNAVYEGGDPTALISPTGGGWTLAMARPLHDTVMDYALDRRLGPRRYHSTEQGQMVTRFVSVRDIHAVVPMLHGRQCRFFAPSNRARWHANALELLLLAAKPAKKRAGKR